MKLYVKDIVREPDDTLYTFLRKVLRLEEAYFQQTTVNETYFDPKFNDKQCIAGKNRSFDDLVLISKTYFKVSDKNVAKAIKKILDNNDSMLFIMCDSANKWILQRNLTKSKVFKYCGTYCKSEYKRYITGVGIYSFNNIITLMGLIEEDIKL